MIKKDYKGQLISFEKTNSNNVMINLSEVAKAFPDKNLSTIVNPKEMQEYISELTEIKIFSSANLQ